MKKPEITECIAIILAATLILTPLAGGVVQNFKHGYWQNRSNYINSDHAINVQGQGWLTFLFSGLTLTVLVFQTYVYHRQRELMEGQLKATQTAAEAALAALDRPWLVIEQLGHNELAWLECREPLIAKFKIANYGKAPAFVKSLRVLHFRGPDHHNGRPPFELPSDVLDFPAPENLNTILMNRGNAPRLLGENQEMAGGIIISGRPRENDPEFVIAGGEKTGVLCSVGYRKLEEASTPGLQPLGVTKSYLIGSVFYEIPGQTPEFLSFCYLKKSGHNFSIYRDYAPYNERKKA